MKNPATSLREALEAVEGALTQSEAETLSVDLDQLQELLDRLGGALVIFEDTYPDSDPLTSRAKREFAAAASSWLDAGRRLVQFYELYDGDGLDDTDQYLAEMRRIFFDHPGRFLDGEQGEGYAEMVEQHRLLADQLRGLRERDDTDDEDIQAEEALDDGDGDGPHPEGA